MTFRLRRVLSVVLTTLVVFGGLIISSVTVNAATDGIFVWEDTTGGVSITAYKGNAENLSIPGTLGGKAVISIGNDTFRDNSTLKSITMPASLKIIGAQAFLGCTQLQTVALNNGLLTIDKGAFRDCMRLKSITIPNSVTAVNSDYWYDNQTFGGCTSLESITIGSGLQDIQAFTFNGCTYLATLTLGSEVRAIGDGAFTSCPNLKTINWNAKLISIGSEAFRGNTSIQSVSFPASLRTIGAMAFYSCTQLQTVTLNNGLLTIDKGAFRDCTRLKSIAIPDSVTAVNSDYWYDNQPFGGCTSLESVTIGAGLQDIQAFTFNGCTYLKRAHLHPNVRSVGDGAFNSHHLDFVICSTSNTAYAKTYAAAIGVPFEVCNNDHRQRYAVTYNANGTGVTNMPANQTKIENEALTLSSTVPIRTGYDFKGWATSTTGAAQYQPGGSYTANAAVTLYAVWESNSVPPTTYSLTVTNGSGSGTYAAGAQVTISANTAPAGKVFDRWTATVGTFANANSASTTFTMPASAATVTATYKDVTTTTNTIFGTKYEATFFNWILFFVGFGWIWMWF